MYNMQPIVIVLCILFVATATTVAADDDITANRIAKRVQIIESRDTKRCALMVVCARMCGLWWRLFDPLLLVWAATFNVFV